MRKMKDSGIEGADIIPFCWETTRLSYECYIRARLGWRGLKADEYVEEGYAFISAFNIQNGNLVWEPLNFISKERFDESPEIKIQVGDVLIVKDGAGVGKCARVDELPIGGTAPNSSIAVITPNENQDYRYVCYYLQSPVFNNFVLLLYNGMGVPHLTQEVMSKIKLLTPPLSQQQKIADYLDRKCSEIDALVIDIQNEIKTLEEYKRSVITEAVTKGLNPDVGMKDSGIEWIGKIPSHWNVTKIGRLYSLRTIKVSDSEYPPLSVTNKGIVPQLETVAKTNAHDDRKLVCKGDFVINSRSDRRGACGISPYIGSVSLINTILCPLTKMNPRYYNWIFHTIQFGEEFYKWGHGIVDDLWTTGWQDMKKITIPIPPLAEQEKIADYLDRKCFEIDSIIKEKQQQLETLAEFQKSLIYEYVTGKKEVIEQTTVVTAVNPLLVLIGKILDKINRHRGKIQVVKLALLIEYLYIPELRTQYYRYPQGPYDIEIDNRLKEINKLGWFDINIDGNPMDWIVGKNYNEFLKLSQQFTQYDDKIASLINSVGNYTENHIGHIATLFAVWNDFILDGVASPSDVQIVKEVVTNWTENKKNTSETVWHRNLDEMKTKGIIPKGNGLHTKKARR